MGDEPHTLQWLRQLRDRRADAERKLPAADLLALTRERAGELLPQFLHSHPGANQVSPRVAGIGVGEDPTEYPPKHPRQREDDRA